MCKECLLQSKGLFPEMLPGTDSLCYFLDAGLLARNADTNWL
jgi:hypothetical protein